MGKLKRGVTKEVEAITGVPLRVVHRIWRNGKVAGGVHGVFSRKAKNCGRKRIDINPEAVNAIDLKDRTTIRRLASKLTMAKSTVHRRLKDRQIWRHTNDVKYTLTEANMRARVQYCMSMLDPMSMPENPTFKSMYNMVYIDEKWFYRKRKNLKRTRFTLRRSCF